MEKEFNLSEKIDNLPMPYQTVINVKDVKEFIKRLKENFKKNQYLCFNSIMEEEIDKEIDKLSGDKLTNGI